MDVRASLVTKWDASAWGAMSEDAIRARWDNGRCRISRYDYCLGAHFRGQMRESVWYVLAGRCRFTSSGQSIELAAGDIAELGAGDYTLEVTEDLRVVKVWELPPGFR
jgi:mannose-6-phosphate isomerase-like protein (cupin superfamily)